VPPSESDYIGDEIFNIWEHPNVLDVAFSTDDVPPLDFNLILRQTKNFSL